MPKLYLKQPGFSYSACWPYREKGNLKYFYRNELEKVCFSHDEAYMMISDKDFER